ncbi:spfh domain-band 7 family protein [Tribonema minus]|uniref:Spfh domain-band 7 family protein n=1 Tax=Tribonema minus TaxID=303371 RepID=A0A835Z4C7_9STRA|nr:spfh domain-band 7 family protein [Tribonema minus]
MERVYGTGSRCGCDPCQHRCGAGPRFRQSGAVDGAFLTLALLDLAVFAIGCAIVGGVYINQPNQSAVLTLFGTYVGTDSNSGLRWANPLVQVDRVSRRTMVTETSNLKVNDASGNPVEIGAAVAWHVDAPAKAVLQVEHYEDFVRIQSETCLRAFASEHPYDHHGDPDGEKTDGKGEGSAEVLTLLGGGSKVTDALRQQLETRLAVAGIVVEEARVMHLAYAPEIAQVMLRRQQARAVIAARGQIVKGAVGMVKDALDGLKEKGVKVDEDRTAALVSNLLVVLVSDREASPVVNAGTIYG